MSENTSGKFPTVFGYIAEAERIALQKCVLETSGVPGAALEVGSLKGLSALLTLSVLESHKMLFCIENGDTIPLLNNIGANYPNSNWNLRNQDFKTVDFEWKLSFVFIDHSHSYTDNIAAFEKFWPLVSPGGIFSFHDYQDPNWADGTRAIDDLIAKYGLTPHITGGSFISFKKP